MTRRRVHTAVTVILVVLYLLGACIAALMLGFAGWRGGWLWSVLAFCVAPVGLVWLRTRTGKPRLAGFAATAAVGLGLAVFAVAATPLSTGRLGEVLSGIDLPPGARLVDEFESGNHWCFDYCPSIDRTYVAPGPASDIHDFLVGVVEDEGFRVVGSLDFESDSTFNAERGDLDLSVTVGEPGDGSADSPGIPPGQVRFSLILDSR